MSSVLFVPCYPGELGWELINYAPHVYYLSCQKTYSQIHVMVREGREAIYPMGTHFYPIQLSSRKSMGNNGPQAPDRGIPAKLVKEFVVNHVKSPYGGCRYIKNRKYIKYQATDESLHKWEHIPKNSVVLCVRGRKFGSLKNWDAENWVKLCKLLLNMNFTPVITGIKESVVFEPPDGCIELLNQTTIEDLIAIMQKSIFVVGQSTGPMHLAALSGVPHTVWGSSRLRDRYLNSWNPHRTLVEYYTCKNEDNQFASTYEEIESLINRMVKRLGIENAHSL